MLETRNISALKYSAEALRLHYKRRGGEGVLLCSTTLDGYIFDLDSVYSATMAN